MVNCNYFEVIEWDEKTQEIYNAVCTMPSPIWPNCNRCQHREEYRDIGNVPGDTVRMQRWANGKQYTLTQGDIDILAGSRSRRVRIDTMDDVEIKNLYDMWKSL